MKKKKSFLSLALAAVLVGSSLLTGGALSADVVDDTAPVVKSVGGVTVDITNTAEALLTFSGTTDTSVDIVVEDETDLASVTITSDGGNSGDIYDWSEGSVTEHTATLDTTLLTSGVVGSYDAVLEISDGVNTTSVDISFTLEEEQVSGGLVVQEGSGETSIISMSTCTSIDALLGYNTDYSLTDSVNYLYEDGAELYLYVNSLETYGYEAIDSLVLYEDGIEVYLWDSSTALEFLSASSTLMYSPTGLVEGDVVEYELVTTWGDGTVDTYTALLVCDTIAPEVTFIESVTDEYAGETGFGFDIKDTAIAFLDFKAIDVTLTTLDGTEYILDTEYLTTDTTENVVWVTSSASKDLQGTLTIEVIDAAGLVTILTFEDVIIDNNSPDIGLNKYAYTDESEVAIQVSDTNLDVENTYVVFQGMDSSDNIDLTAVYNDEDSCYEYYIFEDGGYEGAGTYYFSIYAIDTAGNITVDEGYSITLSSFGDDTTDEDDDEVTALTATITGVEDYKVYESFYVFGVDFYGDASDRLSDEINTLITDMETNEDIEAYITGFAALLAESGYDVVIELSDVTNDEVIATLADGTLKTDQVTDEDGNVSEYCYLDYDLEDGDYAIYLQVTLYGEVSEDYAYFTIDAENGDGYVGEDLDYVISSDDDTDADDEDTDDESTDDTDTDDADSTTDSEDVQTGDTSNIFMLLVVAVLMLGSMGYFGKKMLLTSK